MVIDKADSIKSEEDEESSESFVSNESYYSIHSNDKCGENSHNHKFNKKNSLSSYKTIKINTEGKMLIK